MMQAQQVALSVIGRQAFPARTRRVESVPMWKTEETRFSHHVLTFKAQTSPRDYLKLTCRNAGVTVDEIRSSRRASHLSSLGFVISYDLKTKFGMSYSAIARMLDVDHTSVRYFITRHCERTGSPNPLTSMAKADEEAEKAREMFEAGISIPNIAVSLGMCPRNVRKLGLQRGWYVTPLEQKYRSFVANANEMEVRILANAGLQAKSIARRLKTSESAVSRYMQDKGIHIRALPDCDGSPRLRARLKVWG